jgi:hypothetical protein
MSVRSRDLAVRWVVFGFVASRSCQVICPAITGGLHEPSVSALLRRGLTAMNECPGIYLDGSWAKRAARLLLAGEEEINGRPVDLRALFGGVKRSGPGRGSGLDGIGEFLAPKAIHS